MISATSLIELFGNDTITGLVFLNSPLSTINVSYCPYIFPQCHC